MFSFPNTSIFTDNIIFKQKLVQQPINLPPAKTKFGGKINAGKNTIDIKIIPEKKGSTVKKNYEIQLVKKKAVNSEKRNYKILCLNTKNCDIDKISEILIKKGSEKNFPKLTIN